VKLLAVASSFCALTVWGHAALAVAQGSSPPAASPPGQAAPHVDDLVAIALGRSAEVDILRAKLDAARELVAPAGALPNPTSSVTYTEADFPHFSVGREPMSAVTIEYRQGLPWAGKREARRAVARADVETKARELEELRRQLAREVRTIYARLYTLDRERGLLKAARELLDLLAATASSRYGVGEASEEPVIKAQIEVSKLDERLDDLVAERRVQVAALNRLLDFPIDAPLGTVEDLPPVTVPAGSWIDLAAAHAPSLAVTQAEIDAAEKRLAVAKLDEKPDFSLDGAVGIRGTLPPVVTVGVGIEWPLWKKDKQAPLVRAAEWDVDLARHMQHDAWADLRAEVARLTAEWQRSEQQVRRYKQAILPRTAEAMDAARLAYLNGRGDFSAVVEDFGLWLDARVRLAGREADRFATWAELQMVTGGPAAAGTGEER
jgi:outer membrane protein TolC